MGCRRAWWLVVTLGVVFALSTGDRAILPVLKTTLCDALHLTNRDYSWLVSVFMTTYTGTYFAVGGIIHRLGVKRTLTACVLLLSLSTALSATAHGVVQLAVALMVLGLAQACVVPSVTVTLFNRFAPHRHALAYAVVNAIQSSANVLCPTFVALVTLGLGWRWSFLIPSLAGIGVAALWWNATPSDRVANLDTAARAVPAPSWRALLASRPVLMLILARALSDPFWFFFQYWQAAFLREHIGMSLADIGRLAWIPPLVSGVAMFGFGAISDCLVARGWPVAKARVLPILWVTALAIAAFCLPLVRSMPLAIVLCALTFLMCGAWLSLSAIFMGALVPRHALATALGLMSAVGGISAIALNGLAGAAIDALGYGLPMWIGALLHPLAAALLASHFLRIRKAPRSEDRAETA